MKLALWILGSVLVLSIAVGIWITAVRGQYEPCLENPTMANIQKIEPPLSEADLLRQLPIVKKALLKLQPTQPYIVVDTHANSICLRTIDSVLFKAVCSTGSGGELVDSVSGRSWVFNTPHGVFKVNSKLKNPWWRKPDWAFIEENEAIPKDPSERLDSNVLGDFALGFGDGYFIHGTLYERLLGINVTHGCVRVGAGDLKFIYDRVSIGTPVYIF